MFSSGPNYTKLKTNLRLALNRLKLLEKKKAEITQKSRKEIANFLASGTGTERARIRVEHIIREDYLVEAMEIVEIYSDLILARFGLITQMKELDDGIAEAVSSIVWVSPRLQSDIPELKVISDIFINKYGPQFAENARTATGDHHVSEKLMHKLQLQAPPKLLVEKYLIEIARNYNIEYEPDPQVMKDDNKDDAGGNGQDKYLIDLSDRNNLSSGSVPPHIGFIGYPQIPPLPVMPEPPTNKPFNYPPPFSGGNGGSGVAGPSQPFAYNIPPNNSNEPKDLNTNFLNQEEAKESNNFPSKSANSSANNSPIDENLLRPKMHNDPPPRYSSIDPCNLQNANKPKPQPRSKLPPPSGPSAPPSENIPHLPNVPNDLPDIPNDAKPDNDDDIDFEDLSRRFENLKKRN